MTGAKEDPYRKYLEEKHGKFQTPENLIAEVVEKATGAALIEKTKIVEGEVNEVYDAKTEKENVIVRISRMGPESFENEEKIIRLVSISGVPAPRVLLIENAHSGQENITFCVEEKIEGIPLKKIMKSLSEEELRQIVSEAAQILTKIHSISVENFGSLDGSQSYKTWDGFIFRLEGIKTSILKAGKSVGMDPGLIEQAFKILQDNREIFQIREAKLLHGDFSPKHWLIKDNHIEGVIDFEDAKGGDPIRDLAWLSYFYHDAFPFDWFIGGYTNKELFDNNFNLKMKLYRLHLGLDLLDYYMSEKNKAGLNYTKERLTVELAGF